MNRSDRALLYAAAFALGVLAAVVPGPAKCQVTIGVHLATAHFNGQGHSSTPGLYVALPYGIAGAGTVIGAYRNSLTTPERRTSYYLGQAWQWGRFGIVAAVVSGYTKERVDCPCPAGSSFATCWQEFGFSNNRLLPVLVPSVSWPEARKYIGVVPRLSLLGNRGVHLSIEAPL